MDETTRVTVSPSRGVLWLLVVLGVVVAGLLVAATVAGIAAGSQCEGTGPLAQSERTC